MLRIEHPAFMKIFWQARRAYPLECCGVLLGTRSELALEAVPCDNIAEAPWERYQIAPEELIRVQRDARERGLQIVGFYHSHPEHGAHASAADSAEAYWTGCAYLIVSVREEQVREVRSYRLDNKGKLKEEPVLVVAPAARL